MRSDLQGKRIGILCNQTAFDPLERKYLFSCFGSDLKRVFLPEHGLFAELQDQVPLSGNSLYSYLETSAQFVSLYGESEASLYVPPEKLADLDVLIVDIQDIGSRYYTFATSVSYIIDAVAAAGLPLKIIVLDRPNPAGRQVEGTILPESHASFVGRPGIIHRHGLTLGELCLFYKKQSRGTFELEIVRHTVDAALKYTWEIPPSPNMPGPFTPLVYPGQCLLEGTNLSEGRGTTRPFEIFGAPFLRAFRDAPHLGVPGAYLRPLQFIPAFHKFAGETCSGFMIHLTGEKYHSLSHTLRILRYLKESYSEFEWKKGVYEFRSDRPAIEILVGDPVLLDYLNLKQDWQEVQKLMKQEEEKWIAIVQDCLLYPEPLFRVNIPDF